jgi:hypothetical protein
LRAHFSVFRSVVQRNWGNWGSLPKLRKGQPVATAWRTWWVQFQTSLCSYCMLEAQAPIGPSSESSCSHPAFVDFGIRRWIHQGRPIEINWWNVKAGMTTVWIHLQKVGSKRFILTGTCRVRLASVLCDSWIIGCDVPVASASHHGAPAFALSFRVEMQGHTQAKNPALSAALRAPSLTAPQRVKILGRALLPSYLDVSTFPPAPSIL